MYAALLNKLNNDNFLIHHADRQALPPSVVGMRGIFHTLIVASLLWAGAEGWAGFSLPADHWSYVVNGPHLSCDVNVGPRPGSTLTYTHDILHTQSHNLK